MTKQKISKVKLCLIPYYVCRYVDGFAVVCLSLAGLRRTLNRCHRRQLAIFIEVSKRKCNADTNNNQTNERTKREPDASALPLHVCYKISTGYEINLFVMNNKILLERSFEIHVRSCFIHNLIVFLSHQQKYHNAHTHTHPSPSPVLLDHIVNV